MFREELARHREFLPSLTEAQVERLEAHFRLLLRWNRVLNLSSVRSEPEIVERHYCESLFLGARLPAGAWSIADLGSGAGFPGIPVAILRADCHIALIESHQRKAVFLKEASRELANVRVISGRAEGETGIFDWVISRAVNLEPLGDWLRRHSRAVALLSGAKLLASPKTPGLSGFEWRAPVKLPWGDQRYLHLGENGNVSRETSEAGGNTQP